MNFAIGVEGLKKSYGSKAVLKGISFEVKEGEIFALLGINGAGKTTTLECIEGVKKYDEGEILINGRCGVQLQSSSLPENMKAKEALTLFSKWQRTKVDSAYLKRLSVETFLQKQYRQLSTGQKRRLHLALALLGDPDTVILDEPTAGLDVEGRVAIHGEIKRLQEAGKTIILASHDMAEVGELCNRIAILKNGEIAFLGTAADLTMEETTTYLLKIRFSQHVDFANQPPLKGSYDHEKYWVFQTENIERTLALIMERIKAKNVSIWDIDVIKDGIEERFLKIAKEGQNERDAI